MVALVPVDDRLTSCEADHPAVGVRGELSTEGVEEMVVAVVRSVAESAGGCETFLGVDPETHQVVGTCGFLGPPHGGRVEIAFWTFPPFEGRGWATAMARALVERAYEHPEVHTVLAHTLPLRDPATSVLRANGLARTATVRRDEPPAPGGPAVRGRVWRWELHRRPEP